MTSPYDEMIENANRYAECRHMAVALLANLPADALDPGKRVVVVPVASLRALEAACDHSARQVGYVAGLRARLLRGRR